MTRPGRIVMLRKATTCVGICAKENPHTVPVGTVAYRNGSFIQCDECMFQDGAPRQVVIPGISEEDEKALCDWLTENKGLILA